MSDRNCTDCGRRCDPDDEGEPCYTCITDPRHPAFVSRDLPRLDSEPVILRAVAECLRNAAFGLERLADALAARTVSK